MSDRHLLIDPGRAGAALAAELPRLDAPTPVNAPSDFTLARKSIAATLRLDANLLANPITEPKRIAAA